MSAILSQLFSFLKLLNSDKGTNQIASGVAIGMILGFSPMLSLQTVLIIVVLFFFRIQIGAALVSAFFFKVVAYLIDPLADKLGQWALELESARPLYTELYNLPIIPFSRFNNSIVMGSGLLGLVLAPFVYVIAKIGIAKYRQVVVARFHQTKLFKALQATSFYKWYVKYEQIRG